MPRLVNIIPVEASGEFIVCGARDIIQKLIQVGDYLCFPPNSIEKTSNYICG